MDVFIYEIYNTNKIQSLIKNSYGNYVIQKALLIASAPSKILLINNILNILNKLEDNKLIIKWKHICDSNMQNLMFKNPFLFKNRNNSGFNNNININNNMRSDMYE